MLSIYLVKSLTIYSPIIFTVVKLSTTETAFIFDNKLYKQIDGVAMGSPLGPKLINALLCYYEKIRLNKCPSQFKPVVYRRYIEHIFVVFISPYSVRMGKRTLKTFC